MAETSERTSALGAATNAANRRLRTAHQDEWNSYMQEEAIQRGQDWKPRQSAEQKAERDLARLIEQYPHLAEKIKSEGVGAVI